MANESTWGDINSLIPEVYEGALQLAAQMFFMPTLVQNFTDLRGMEQRTGAVYPAGSVSVNLGETDDLDNHRQNNTPTLQYTLTPQEIGTQYLFTDRRTANEYNNEVADAQYKIGYDTFLQVEKDLLSHFSAFTGGTIGQAGGTLTWGSIYDAVAILRAAGVPAPYFVVLHEFHYRRLAQEANIAGLQNPAPLQIREGIQTMYQVQQIGNGIFLYTTGVPVAGTAVFGGVFSRTAIGFDVRRGLRIEPQRDASKRALELNASMIYAHGETRKEWGVALLGNAVKPS